VSLARLYEVHKVERRLFFRRPLTWVLVILLFLTAWGLAAGNVTIQSGDSAVGGQKAWMNSEFSLALFLSVLVFLYYSFFVAIAAGMSVIRDEELKVGELLHATPLTPAEYLWGKLSAVVLGFLVVLLLQLGFHALSFHVLAGAGSEEYVGPFHAASYLRPALILCVPLIVFLAGTSFALGTWTRRPIVVFAFPVALVLAFGFFSEWSPSWLDPRVNRLLGWLDPTGLRWMDETWLKVDRGVDFYNTSPVVYDAPFVASRLLPAALGLLLVGLAVRRYARGLRGATERRGRRAATGLAVAGAAAGLSAPRAPRSVGAPLADLRMRSRRPGFLSGLLAVLRVELRELRGQPGLYLFVPLILLQVLLTSTVAVGAFDTPLLLTPGVMATRTLGTLTLLLTLLLMFYTVESLVRERASGLAAIHYATPVKSSAVLFGKTLANAVLGVAVAAAALLGCWIVLLVQGTVPFDLLPFALVWGGLLVPTLVLWCAFVAAVFSITRSRYATYAVALAALIATFYFRLRDEMSWVGDWFVWRAVPWSDMAPFQLDLHAIVLNRLLALALALFFTALAVRFFPRREADAASTLLRLRPRSLARAALGLAPFWIPPLVLGLALNHAVQDGPGGDRMEKRAKDYWRRNVATWKDADLPDVTHVDVDVEIEPERHWFRTRGTYRLANRLERPIARFPVTPGFSWKELEWSMEGRPLKSEDHAGLAVFDLDPPLAPGETIALSFSFEGREPDGVSKNGGGTDEFILPGGVVLTCFNPTFVPVLGYLEGIGVDKDNKSDARDWPDDFYQGVTKAAFGSQRPFTTRIRITAPEAYRMNSVGVLSEDTVADGRRTVVWTSDEPVHFFDIVGGRWDVRRGDGVAIYYHPTHPYNVDEMLGALEAARRWYSEWFHPFPWKELKLSEFPALAGYAQGFPTNIPFSEALGFLTKRDPKANAAFHVTAHESAHQWWPNLVIPGEGPGGNVLSEGMAHFSTILLTEQVRGPRERIEFCKRIEERYGDDRRVDSERPLVKTDGSRPGDTTVTYDKGGFVFWMLLQHMGREECLEGLRAFLERYMDDPDHPVLQDFVATLRPFAPDPQAYDAFCRQWFFEVVVPEYRLSDVAREQLAADDGAELWEVRATLENAGTGRMPVEVAATRGVRFPDAGDGDAPGPGVVEAAAKDAWREERVTVELGAGERRAVVLRCAFKPERLIVDPDARVLQLKREKAVADL
jgi:ABC-2 type transport system permease protein